MYHYEKLKDENVRKYVTQTVMNMMKFRHV